MSLTDESSARYYNGQKLNDWYLKTFKWNKWKRENNNKDLSWIYFFNNFLLFLLSIFCFWYKFTEKTMNNKTFDSKYHFVTDSHCYNMNTNQKKNMI